MTHHCDYRFDHDRTTDRPTGEKCTALATHKIFWDDGRRYSFACADHLTIDSDASVKPASIVSLARQRPSYIATRRAAAESVADDGGYPPGWPRCPGCGAPALDGHITCGDVACEEGRRR